MNYSLSVIILICFACLPIHTYAQDHSKITGTVLSADSLKAIPSANIILYNSKDGITYKATSFTNSDKGGFFSITTPAGIQSFRLVITHILFRPDTVTINATTGNMAPLQILLKRKTDMLKEVMVKNSVRISGDTVEFAADAFRRPDTRKVEDLLRNMDGFSITDNGRIFYRGKEIKAVLINGENLTREQYEILTQNLNASLIDKVQVFDNYNENRIIGSLLPSGEAGINLTLNNELEGKLSGSLSAGTSFKGQDELDANIVWLKGRIKWINLLQYNSISRPNFTESSRIAITRTQEPETAFIPNFFNRSQLVALPSIALPPLDKTYTRPNSDYIINPLLHIRLSAHLKLAIRYAASKASGEVSDNSLTDFYINPQTRYFTADLRRLQERQTQQYISADISHDNQKKLAGSLYIEAAAGNRRTNFSNLTGGIFTDTLAERFYTRSRGIHLQYTGALRLTPYSVMALSAHYNYDADNNELSSETSRYNKFWQLGDERHRIWQNLDLRPSGWTSRLSVIRKKGAMAYSIGLQARAQVIKSQEDHILAGPITSMIPADTVSAFPRRFSLSRSAYTVRASLSRTLRPNLIARLSGEAGVQKMDIPHLAKKEQAGSLNLEGLLQWKLRAFSGATMVLSHVRDLPPLHYFIPGQVIHSTGSLFSGTGQLNSISYSKLELGYNVFKVLSGTSLQVSFSGKKSASDYVFASTIDTTGMIIYPINVFDNWEYGGSVAGKKYFFPIRSALSLSYNLRKDNGNTIVNNAAVRNRQTDQSVSLSYLSKFNFPLNVELSYTYSMFKNLQGGDGATIRTSTHSNSISARSRLQFTDAYYLGASYNYFRWRGQQTVQSMDVFAAYVLSKKWMIDLKCHNLFNIRRFEQVYPSPNVTLYQSVNAVGRYFFIRGTFSF